MLAYGESDEFSFVLKKGTTLYGMHAVWACLATTGETRRSVTPELCGMLTGRRTSKLISIVVSLFAASYVRLWPTHFPTQPLLATPCFDGRAVLYPSDRSLRDYLAWRQVDTHINNQVRTRCSSHQPCSQWWPVHLMVQFVPTAVQHLLLGVGAFRKGSC